MSVPIVKAVRAPRPFAKDLRARMIDANVRRGRADLAELAPRRGFVALAMLAAISAWLGAAALIAQPVDRIARREIETLLHGG